MTEAEFLRIRWPARVVVHYLDGTSEALSGINVLYEAPADDPSGEGKLSFEMLPAHGRQRHLRGVSLPEIARIVGDDSQVLWLPAIC